VVKDVFVDGNGGWLGAVSRVGVPVVLAVGLTWFLVTRVETTQALIISNQAAIVTTQYAISASISEARGTMSSFSTIQMRDTRVMTALLLQTCINTARGAEQQSACLASVIAK